jgi:hypothetical protein
VPDVVVDDHAEIVDVFEKVVVREYISAHLRSGVAAQVDMDLVYERVVEHMKMLESPGANRE